MASHAAFLRGVSPMNCKMPALAHAFEAAGFSDVRTVLSSGNVVFAARGAEHTLRRKAEDAMADHLGQSFLTLVRPLRELQDLLEADPYAAFDLPPQAKRVVTFLQAPPSAPPALPRELDGATILALRGREVLTAYVPSAKGAAFMGLIERTFGKEVTTRTWDTVRKVCAAGAA